MQPPGRSERKAPYGQNLSFRIGLNKEIIIFVTGNIANGIINESIEAILVAGVLVARIRSCDSVAHTQCNGVHKLLNS